ncbi:hypothetical protein KS4_08260 [Poriferisphaera corsica]|uniref:Uncharacterized protein n=1 Tax=Poriferisphaera corsica TaxID=2528020 RepID=A0A517YRH1_9BACT|nr:hypothetical protein [Poriferisphaera corsica]QDU32791.1 hypothetical protein KS4_08260 [Poriferisphaera corsica]
MSSLHIISYYPTTVALQLKVGFEKTMLRTGGIAATQGRVWKNDATHGGGSLQLKGGFGKMMLRTGGIAATQGRIWKKLVT